MAAQIALLFVRRLQVPVVMTDLDQARVDSGVAYVHAEIDKQLVRGRLSADAANRQKALISGSVSKDGFADADFVIEAVFEELGVKRQVFAEVEAVVAAGLRARDQHLLALGDRDGGRTWRTRSGSSASTSSTRSRCCRWSRSSGARRPTTPPWRPRSTAGKTLKKNCVIVADQPAFVVNRLLTRFLGEIIRTVDEGTAVRGRGARGRPPRPAR